jgi:hypothetical protein
MAVGRRLHRSLSVVAMPVGGLMRPKAASVGERRGIGYSVA